MEKTEYTLYWNSKQFEKIQKTEYTIALVTDLHERKPDGVLTILREESPDMIAVAGDLFENHEFGENLDREDESKFSRLVCKGIHLANRLAGMRYREKHHIQKEDAYHFLRNAAGLAPVMMSIGNHELYLTNEDRQVIAENGVILLEDDWVLKDGMAFGGLTSKSVTGKLNTEFLNHFSALLCPKVLLCHHPEYYPAIQDGRPPLDLILSGHCHGGQIRIFGRGIFSPGQGLFPKYTRGLYDGRLVVSAGCANTASIPRWGNPTEVVMVRIKKLDKSFELK